MKTNLSVEAEIVEGEGEVVDDEGEGVAGGDDGSMSEVGGGGMECG